MINGIWTIYPGGLSKGFDSKFHISCRVQYETSKKGQRMYQPKPKYNNKDEDNSLITRNIFDEAW